jgi:CheY-like chemotaxis protein
MANPLEKLVSLYDGKKAPCIVILGEEIKVEGQEADILSGAQRVLERAGCRVEYGTPKTLASMLSGSIKPDVVIGSYSNGSGESTRAALEATGNRPPVYIGVVGYGESEHQDFSSRCDVAVTNGTVSMVSVASVALSTYAKQAKPLAYVVDDSEEQLEIVETMLKRFGYDVITESSTNAARDALVSGIIRPAVLLLDYNNPGQITGDEVAQSLTEEQRARTRVVGMSGYHREHQDSRLYDAQLDKPFRLAALENAVSGTAPDPQYKPAPTDRHSSTSYTPVRAR